MIEARNSKKYTNSKHILLKHGSIVLYVERLRLALSFATGSPKDSELPREAQQLEVRLPWMDMI